MARQESARLGASFAFEPPSLPVKSKVSSRLRKRNMPRRRNPFNCCKNRDAVVASGRGLPLDFYETGSLKSEDSMQSALSIKVHTSFNVLLPVTESPKQPSSFIRGRQLCIGRIPYFDDGCAKNGLLRQSSSQTFDYLVIKKNIKDWEENKLNRTEMDLYKRFLSICIEKYGEENKKFMKLLHKQHSWLKSFHRQDPRFQIRMYFNEVARQGGPLKNPIAPAPIPILRCFNKAAAISIWRPTSADAIKQMMTGSVTGKGMNIKGKSAKRGILSGMIPFVQIHDEKHKKKVHRPPAEVRMKIYYKTAALRRKAEKEFRIVAKKLKKEDCNECPYHKRVGRIPLLVPKIEYSKSRNSLVLEPRFKEVNQVNKIDDIGFCLDVSQRLFFETYIMKQKISSKGTKYETGRPSEPVFQDMNFKSLLNEGFGPEVVVLQTCTDNALRPQSLVLAYEEHGRVTPVASDFDCFTVATRGVVYDEPIPFEQVQVMQSQVDTIADILESPSDKCWTSRWLEKLKTNEEFHDAPPYGFGDPKSSKMMEGAVERFSHNGNGAVRHGAECFNYSFPQELDDEFLVISDELVEYKNSKSNSSFTYMNVEELQDFLYEKIDAGYILPLNPKWIMADKGWKRVYDKMMASKDIETMTSMDTWYPKDSGVRDQIEHVYRKFPDGFQQVGVKASGKLEGTEAMDLAMVRLRRFQANRRLFQLIKKAILANRVASALIRHSSFISMDEKREITISLMRLSLERERAGDRESIRIQRSELLRRAIRVNGLSL